MLTVQRDVYSAFDHSWRNKSSRRSTKRPDQRIAGGCEEYYARGTARWRKRVGRPMITTLVYQQLLKLVIERAAVGMADTYQSFMARSVIEKLLRERPRGGSRITMLCCSGALRSTRSGSQDPGVQRVRAGITANFRMCASRVRCRRLPLIGKYFNIGPVPMGGRRQASSSIRAVGSFAPDGHRLGRLEHSFANLATGESATGCLRIQRPVGCLLRRAQFPMPDPATGVLKTKRAGLVKPAKFTHTDLLGKIIVVRCAHAQVMALSPKNQRSKTNTHQYVHLHGKETRGLSRGRRVQTHVASKQPPARREYRENVRAERLRAQHRPGTCVHGTAEPIRPHGLTEDAEHGLVTWYPAVSTHRARARDART